MGEFRIGANNPSQRHNHQHQRRNQPARSWRASGEGQISLSASAGRAFANFCDKKHCIIQLQIFRTKTVVFETKNVFFLQLHENGHFHGATFISDDLSVHYDS